MAGRKGGDHEPRPQKAKQAHGFGRGHGMHHRPGDGAPRPIGTGRRRGHHGTREHGWIERHDDELVDLALGRKSGEGHQNLEVLTDAPGRGARLQGLVATGTVMEVQRGCCLVALKTVPVFPGGAPLPGILRAVPRGMMEHFDLGLASLVAAGDEVEVVVPPMHGQEEYDGLLARVLPRRSEFRRLHPSGRAIQTLAANVAQVVIVASTAEPPFRPGFVDRVLVCAAASDLPAVVVLNKIDLGIPAETAELVAVYRGLGVKVLPTSAVTREGLEELRQILAVGRSVLCGHSGVGKSSLILALAPELAGELRIAEVSTRTQKGMHTTTHARLYPAPWGEIIDAPGVREFTPADTDRQNLWAWFPELAARQGQCAFADCTHTVEKGCAILAAVEAGAIHPRRHESYVRIHETLTS